MTPETLAWFAASVGTATRVQQAGWAAIARGANALLIAPTGSGKTLAAFLHGIDRLLRLSPDAPDTVRLLYVSPLKALAVDVERNLTAPLAALKARAAADGRPFRDVQIGIRTGDTSPAERARQRRRPPDILVTTPESLFLIVSSGARESLRGVDLVIVDEVHALAGTKRGVHLALTLERLAARATQDPQRIGLSATCRPTDSVAAWLAGDRPVEVIDTSEPPNIAIQVETVTRGAEPLRRPPPAVPAPVGAHLFPREDQSTDMGLWAAVIPRLIQVIHAHRTTLVFTNSRQLCERLTHRINEVAGEEIARSHHGSLDHARRALVERALKAGELRCLVATSTLELGIDIGSVDFVVMIGSPQSAARGLQRLGRAGHQVGARSFGEIQPKHPPDLLEAAAVAAAMGRGEVEPTHLPSLCLDVLAQQIAAMVAVEPWHAEDLLALVRRTRPYRSLTRSLFDAVLDQLSGRFPSEQLADLDPRIVWDRQTDQLRPRTSTRRIVVLNGGTIPDKGLFRVQLAGDGARLGELDEEMVFELRRGDTILLGASTWRVELIEQDRVQVSPAPGMPGRLPFWKGDSPGRPAPVGRAMGALIAGALAQPAADRAAWLASAAPVSADAARDLAAWITGQEAAAGVATDRRIVFESFRDDLGDWQVCIHNPLGARVNAAWGMWLQGVLSERAGFEVRATWTDDGILVRLTSGPTAPAIGPMLPDPAGLRERLLAALGASGWFAARFRENASRALLLPKHRPGRRSPLWRQRKKAADLLASVRKYPDFPVVLETVRECLDDEMDLPATTALFEDLSSGRMEITEVVTPFPSPFAREILNRQTLEQLYEQDGSPAERRAQLLGLDPRLLTELLGEAPLGSLLDAEAIDIVERELQGWHRARDADGLHDLLRRLGPTPLEAIERRIPEASAWLTALSAERQAFVGAGRDRAFAVAIEDAALARDALGVRPPADLPAALAAPVQSPVHALLGRYGRVHGPMRLERLRDAWGLSEPILRDAAGALLTAGRWTRGALHPDVSGEHWCDADVLRTIQRRALERARQRVEPEDDATYQRFLLAWHGVGGRRSLEEALDRLAGASIPWEDLTERVLPARVAGFDPRQLDELGALGGWVWIADSAAPLRVRVLRREQAADRISRQPAPEDPEELRMLTALERRGSAFFTELCPRGVDVDAAEAALWRLVGRGLVSSDTFAPLRARVAARRGARATGGRWWPTSLLTAESPPDETARRVAQVRDLLNRHGIVSRALTAEVDGGFSALWPVLKEMESRGLVRRGWFVRSLGGAQFADPTAASQVRAARDAPAPTCELAATDPALAWGASLAWSSAGPRRVPGARIALVDGRPAWGSDGKRAYTLGSPLADTLTALDFVRSRLDYQRLRFRALDGVAAPDIPGDRLAELGLGREGVEIILDRSAR